jgi:hypothetical protein
VLRELVYEWLTAFGTARHRADERTRIKGRVRSYLITAAGGSDVTAGQPKVSDPPVSGDTVKGIADGLDKWRSATPAASIVSEGLRATRTQ